jgi:hypothetical protein
MHPGAKLRELTDNCTVQVMVGDKGKGTGFFVAPGTVLTCAHVVAVDDHAVPDVKVKWRGVTYTGTASARPPEALGARVWNPPDLCVISLDSPPPGHPTVILSAKGGDDCDVYIVGYNKVFSDTPELGGSWTGRLTGWQQVGGDRMRQVTGVSLEPGMSGGPVLDLRRGVVCGVVKTQRLPDSDMGGLVIPVELVQREFKAAWRRSQRSAAANAVWTEQRRALRSAFDPLEHELNEEENALLSSVADELRLTGADFADLAYKVTRRVPENALGTLGDLLAEIAEGQERDRIDPVTRLFVWLAYDPRIADNRSRELQTYALIRQGGKRTGLPAFMKTVESLMNDDGGSALVARVSSDDLGDKNRLTLEMWWYASLGATGEGVAVDSGPHTRHTVKKAIIDGLNKVPLVRGKTMIEFALPDRLLDDPVEEWDLGDGVPLSERYPVVIRLSDRKLPRDVNQWKVLGQSFEIDRMPFRDSLAWDDLWLTCRSGYTPRDLNRVFMRVRLPVLAMTAWHDRRRSSAAIAAAKQAGASVIVWHHKPCADQACAAGSGTGGTGNGSGACQGKQFQQLVEERLSAEALTALPQKVLDARVDQSLPRIAIIWDDPRRVPWEGGPVNSYPSRSPEV